MGLPVWKRKALVSSQTIAISPVAAENTQRDAFLSLISEYGPALRRLAAAYCQDAADREDLFQEIAVALWQAIPRFRGESSTRTWLYRIAHNVAISATARRRRRARREENMAEAFDPPSPARDSEAEAIRSQKLELLAGAIRRISVVDRQIILLYLEGLSYAELREITGLSEIAVATRLSRIREKLKEAIREREPGGR